MPDNHNTRNPGTGTGTGTDENKSKAAVAAVSMQQVNKWFDQFHVLRDINLDVQVGEKIVICGPSGSGKSTLIRCICKLEDHQQGVIEVLGTCLLYTSPSPRD